MAKQFLFSSCVAAATLVCGEWRVFSSYCMLVECCTQCLVQFWLSAWLVEFHFGMNPHAPLLMTAST